VPLSLNYEKVNLPPYLSSLSFAENFLLPLRRMRTIALKMADLFRREGKYSYLARTLQILITVALGWFIFNRLQSEEIHFVSQLDQLSLWAYAGILMAIILMPCNLLLEATKWQWMIRHYYPDLTLRKAFQALLAGMTTGIFTPNRLGEYVGRLMYLPAGGRTEAGVYMLWERIFQMMITSWMGSLGLWYLAGMDGFLADTGLAWLGSVQAGWILLGINALFPLFLLQPGMVSRWLKKLKLPGAYAQRMTDSLGELDRTLLLKVLGLGVLRYSVFSSQYLILLYAFGYEGAAITGMAMIWLVFLAKSIVPFFAFTELGLRESIALLIMGPVGVSAFSAFSSTFILYLINVIFPALIGLIFVYRIRWQK